MVDGGDVRVTVNGRPARVRGVFDGESYEALRDIDGSDLLPFVLSAALVAPFLVFFETFHVAGVFARDLGLGPGAWAHLRFLLP